MEEVFSRRKVLEPAELKRLNERSDAMGALQMGSHLGLVLVLGYCHWLAMGAGGYWMLATGFGLGVAVNFLYAAQHELSHWTVFRTRWLNELFGRIIGFLMLFPRDYDLIMHYSHHRFTQDWKKDGELVRDPYTFWTFLIWMSGITYWRNRVLGIVRRARGIVIEPYIHSSEEAAVVRESRWHLVGYAAVAAVSVWLGSAAALWFWLLPMLLTKPVHQLQNTIEHLGLAHTEEILDNTRSTRTNFFMRWLCWQMPYHTAHHLFPSVPFWKLRQLDRKIAESGSEVQRMGWIEFQIEAFRRLWAHGEDFYAYNEIWIVPDGRGGTVKLEA